MGLLDAVSEDTKPRPEVAVQPSVITAVQEQPESGAPLALGMFAVAGVIGIALATLAGAISPMDAAIIAGGMVGIIMMFSVLKLFIIAATLKAILTELRKGNAKPPAANSWDENIARAKAAGQ